MAKVRPPPVERSEEAQMAFRVSLVGAGVGALIGGIGRAAVAAFHFTGASGDLTLVVLIAAGIGIVIGALAGATGRPLLGATVGAALSAVIFMLTLPAVAFLQLLGAGTLPSVLEVVAAGALAGGIGGAMERVAARRR